MKEDKDHIETILAKVLTNQGTAEEVSLISEWCARSVENQKVYDHYKSILEIDKSHFIVPELDIDVKAEWNKFNERIGGGTKTVEMKTSNPVMSWMKVAAAILLMVASTYLIYNFLFTDDIITHQTAENKQEFVLPDKSVITVNAYSSISYSSEFGVLDRNIELDGEAYFDVKRNEKKPFIITTEKAKITVLGTSFNVRSSEKFTSVTVTSGLVSLAPVGSDKEVKLSVGEFGEVDEMDQITKSLNENKNFNSWMTGIITFDNTSLNTVVESLNSIYHANISISNEVSQSCSVTVTFDNQSLESVLNVLTSTLDLTIEKDGEDIEITKAGC